MQALAPQGGLRALHPPSAAAQLSQLVLAPWRQRDRSPWLRGIIYGGFVLLMAALLWFLPPRFKLWLMASTAALVLQGLWWWLGASLLEQNHPTAARLVPGHLRSLRRTALLGWAIVSVASSLCLWPLLPNWGRELLLGSAGLAVLGLWLSRRPVLWLGVFAVWSLGGAYRAELAPLMQALASLWAVQADAMLLLALVAQAALVVAALGSGNSRHQARYTRMSQLRQAMRMQQEDQAFSPESWGPLVKWLSSPFQRTHALWLRRCLQTGPAASPQRVMARVAIVLHGASHWVHHAMVVLVVLWLVAAGMAWAAWRYGVSPAAFIQHGGMGLAVGVVSLALNPVLVLAQALWTSRREQALLRLLPGVPQGRALNRAVVLLQLRRFAWAWLLATVLSGLLAQLSGRTEWLVLSLAALPFAALTLVASPAGMSAPTAVRNLLPFLGFYALAFALAALVRGLEVPLWQLALPLVLVAAGLLAWQWRHVNAASTALPAGRWGA